MELEFGGKRYLITAGENIIGAGRDCALVLPGKGVKPRHAILLASPVGMAVRAAAPDAPIQVNGMPVGADPRLVRPGDTIVVGPHELRLVDPEAEADSGVLIAPSGATYRLADTMHGMPVAVSDMPRSAQVRPSNGSAVALASFLVRSGEQKGRRLAVGRVSASIGRAEHSDIVIGDPSVSAEHARLRRRDGLWTLIDVGSATGTYVDGERVTDEVPLVPGATVRLGDVSLLFDPYDEPASEVGVAAAAAAEPPPAPWSAMPERPPAPRRARPAPPPPPPVQAPRRHAAVWVIAAVVFAAAAGAAVGFLLLR